MLHGPNGIFGFYNNAIKNPVVSQDLFFSCDNINLNIEVEQELLTNPGFTVWESGVPVGWNVVKSVPSSDVTQVGSGESFGGTGIGCVNLYQNGASPQIYQNPCVAGEWYRFGFKLDNNITTKPLTAAYQQPYSKDFVTPGIYYFTGRAKYTSFIFVCGSSSTDITVDDATTKHLINIYKVWEHPDNRGDFSVTFTSESSSQTGIVLNWIDDNNYDLVYLDRITGKVFYDKKVNKIWISKGNWPATHLNNGTLMVRVRKNYVVDIFYAGTTLVSDIESEEFVGNCAGVFSTSPQTEIKKYTWNASVLYDTVHTKIYGSSLPICGKKVISSGWDDSQASIIDVSNSSELIAALQLNIPRIIKPQSGTYSLSGALYVPYGTCTIDASDKDVIINNGGLYFDSKTNLKLLNIKFRNPGGATFCLRCSECDNVLVRNCSFYGQTQDDTVGSVSATNVTFEYCLWHNNLYSYHPYHKVQNILIHHCLFYDCHQRNPKFGDSYDVSDEDIPDFSSRFINNVVAAWYDYASSFAGKSMVDFIENVYVPGPNSNTIRREIVAQDYTSKRKAFLQGNIGPSCKWGDGWNGIVVSDLGGKEVSTSFSDKRLWQPLSGETSALQALSDVLTYVGARDAFGNLDEIDQTAIDGTLSLWNAL